MINLKFFAAAKCELVHILAILSTYTLLCTWHVITRIEHNEMIRQKNLMLNKCR